MIPLFKPPQLQGSYIGRVLASRWLTTGPECDTLRQDLAARFGWDPAAIVLGSSATACWWAWLDVTGPGWASIDLATWPGMLHYERGYVKQDEAKYIYVDTHIGGAAFSRPSERAKRDDWDNTFLDACHSWLPDPAYDASLVSFYPTKLVPGAEGGALFLNPSHAHLADRIELALNCGQVPASKRGNAALRSGFGRKGNMTDVQAALNREALELHEQYVLDIEAAWQLLADQAQLAGVAYRDQPVRAYLFQIEVPPGDVQAVRDRLAARGIQSAWNFPPAGLVTLPCYPGLSKSDAAQIISAAKQAIREEPT